MTRVGDDWPDPGLPAQERALRELFHRSHDSILLLDLARDRIVNVNPAAAQMLGYSREEMLTRRVSDVHPHDMDKFLEFARSVMSNGLGRTEELSCLARSGERIPVAMSAAVFLADPEGRRLVLTSVRDLRGSKRSEEALRRSEERYRALYNKAPVMLHSADDEGRLVSVSDHWCKSLGCERRQVLGQPVTRFLTEASRQRAEKERLPHFTRPGTLVNEPFEFRTETGDVIDVLVSAVTEHEDGGTHSLAVSVDITEAKRIQDALRESEERYRCLVELFPEGISVTVDGLLAYINPAGVRLLGASHPDELLGRPVEDFVPVEYRQRTRQIRARAIASNLPQGPFEQPILRLDGTLIDAEFLGAPVSFAGKQGIQTVIRDVSERRKAEDSLRESEAKWRSLVEHAPNFIVRTNPLGVIQFANREFHGVRPEDLIEKSIYDFVNPAEADLFRRHIDRVVQTGDATGFEANGVPGLDRSFFAVRVGAVTHNERVVGTTIILTDITDLKRAEREIQKLMEHLELENAYLREEVTEGQAFGDIIGESTPVRAVLDQIDLVSNTRANVLILGESGTGKELVAREIHRRGDRAGHPLIKVNCASIPRELFESEFFGHVKGAFTGALRERAGRFEAADGGTLFLDEVGEIPLELQGKLLRVLQEGEYERVGEDRTRSVDVRVVAATNRNLQEDVEAGLFRRDLYYRLNVFPIQLGPLRQRREDIPLLATVFVDRAANRLKLRKPRLTKTLMRQLQAYDWPGNVRELQNVLERFVITARSGVTSLNLPRRPSAPRRAAADDETNEIMTDEEFRRMERANIVAALDRTEWTIYGKHGAARLVGVQPTTLASRMKRLGITKPVRDARG